MTTPRRNQRGGLTGSARRLVRGYRSGYLRVRRVLGLLTFLGVVVHEFAHKLFCDWYRIPVKEVCYFQLDNPPGYVKHARPRAYRHTFLISVAPFVVNTAVAYACFGVLAYWAATVGLPAADPTPGFAAVVGLGWLGVSSGLHAFPSREDANSIWTQTKSKLPWNPFVLLGVPVVVLILVVGRLRPLFADLVYTGALAALAVSVVGRLV